jgi:transcriptional regulator with XRE-family HTH domain
VDYGKSGAMTKNDRPHKEIANRLRAFRETLGLNQKDFAQKHNFSPSQYANWETGERRIPVESAALLEDRYGLTLDFIYLGRLRTLPHSLANDLSDSPLLSK